MINLRTHIHVSLLVVTNQLVSFWQYQTNIVFSKYTNLFIISTEVFPNGGSTKTISVHPIKKELVVATSKQTCMLFDIRSVKEVNSRVMPIQEYIGHTRAISSAFLSPLTGEKLATVAYDNKIRFYEVGGSNKTESPSKSIHHNNQTGRWLSTFQVWNYILEWSERTNTPETRINGDIHNILFTISGRVASQKGRSPFHWIYE